MKWGSPDQLLICVRCVSVMRFLASADPESFSEVCSHTKASRRSLGRNHSSKATVHLSIRKQEVVCVCGGVLLEARSKEAHEPSGASIVSTLTVGVTESMDEVRSFPS